MKKEMKIYVGRWNLLPEELEGNNELSEKSEKEIAHECEEEKGWSLATEGMEDKFVGVYTPKEFEETFNGCLDESFAADIYWIRIF